MNRYSIIIDERDFKKIKMSLDVKANQKFWAFSKKDKERFAKIRKGDMVYFGKQGFASWQFIFKLSKKEKNSNLVTNVWGKDFRSKNASLVLHFEEKNYLGLKEHLRYVRKLHKFNPGIYDITKKIVSGKSEQEYELTETLRGIPKTKIVMVKQKQRDAGKVKKLKKFYQHKCQVCLDRIQIGNQKYYSEVHHLRPVGKEDGEDDLPNMMVVCPNHHKAFEYCAIRISLDGKNIVDRNNKIMGKLYLKKSHTLSSENINYQFYRRLK